MKARIVTLLACLALACSPALAAKSETEPPTKPADAKEAGTKTAVAPEPMSQQERMKTCNEKARKKELKGDERRAFMSTCLKG